MADAAAALPTMADHDGFVEAFYHLLWAKTFNGEPCQVLVPDTVIYKYRIPAYWYFTGGDGRLRRKNKASIVNQKIFKDFTAGARSDKDVVACYISETPLEEPLDDEGPPARTETIIQYFDRATLRDFLFNQEKTNDGCLQKFVRPKGLFNSMIQAAWSPQLCLIERRVNLSPLLSGRAPLQERTATYEGSEHLSRIAPVRGTLLADRVQQLCADMTAHIAATSPAKQKVSRMLINFKTDANDNVWFLWCASVRLRNEDELGSQRSSPNASPIQRRGGSLSSESFADLPPSKGDIAPAFARPARRDATESKASLSKSPSFMGASSASSASQLAPVCLNPSMSSPSFAPRPKRGAAPEAVCPFSGEPLNNRAPYFVTYRQLLDYQTLLDLRSGVRREITEVPPLLLRVCPDLDPYLFAREHDNPLSLFLHTRVLCSELAYLEFSTVALPGVKVLPSLSAKTKRSLVASASAPSLPPIPGATGRSSRELPVASPPSAD